MILIMGLFLMWKLVIKVFDQSIWAIISQKIHGEEHAITFASRTLTKSERAYFVTRKELLALVTFVKQFKHYLLWEELFGKDRSQLFEMAHELQKPRRTECRLDKDIVLL